MRRACRRHPVVAFFVLAYVVSALFGVPVIASSHGVFGIRVPGFLGLLAAIGPAVAVVLVIGLTEGAGGLARLCTAAVRRPVHAGYYAVALAFSPIVLAVSYAATGSVGKALPVVAARLPTVLPMFLLLVLVAGVGEEVGWRGFAQSRLQQRWRPLPAALIVGLVWAGWHLPLFAVASSMQGRLYQALGVWGIAGYSGHLILMAVLYAWLLNASGGSVLMPILAHGGTNTFSWLVGMDKFSLFGLQPTLWYVALHALAALTVVWRWRVSGGSTLSATPGVRSPALSRDTLYDEAES